MDYFNYQNGALHAEEVNLTDIATSFGTPCYVYSRATLERHWRAFDQALGQHPHLICYAVKANSNMAVLNVLARLGSGFDIVSGGELQRVLRAGGDPTKIVFSGVGKKTQEMQDALNVDIRCFNVESEAELTRLNEVARAMAKTARVSVRVNPDVDAGTHPYISTGLKENKFGISIDDALRVYQYAASLPNLQVIGIDCHIGSQLTSIAPFVDALGRVLQLVNSLKQHGIELHHLDLGGGLGVRYADETPPLPNELAAAVLENVGNLPYEIIFEPGRAIAANAGVLLTRIEYLKHNEHKHFAVVDAAMNDLIRPSLYGAWQDITPVTLSASGNAKAFEYDIVGPICETADFLGKKRYLALTENELLAVRSAGAYGFVMSSNYNTRPRAAEVMVDGKRMHLVRARETVEDLLRGESLLPED